MKGFTIESDMIFAIMIASIAFLLFYSYVLDYSNIFYNEAKESSNVIYVNAELQHFIYLEDSGNGIFSNINMPFSISTKLFNPFNCTKNCSSSAGVINRLVYIKGRVYEISANQ